MRVIAALILLTLTASVMAEQYWVEYDPSAGLFPEEVGWTRIVYGGGAERYFEDGALVLDGMASTQIADVYQMCRPGMLDPGAGELFMARWTLRVDELVGYGDAVVVINADDARGGCMMFHEGLVRSLLEPGLHAFFEPHQYHDFELRSSDMETYQLLIDGVAALAGSFKGSSRISGERGTDLEEEVLVIAEPVGHPLHDLDLVVDAFQQAGV